MGQRVSRADPHVNIGSISNLAELGAHGRPRTGIVAGRDISDAGTSAPGGQNRRRILIPVHSGARRCSTERLRPS
jgi:hypothetical protein